MNLHKNKFVLSKGIPNSYILADSFLLAWPCGGKLGLLSSSAKPTTLEPPVRTGSGNSFFQEHLNFQYALHLQIGPQPVQGLKRRVGWRGMSSEGLSWSWSLSISHQPADRSSPPPAARATSAPLTTARFSSFLHTGKWLLLLGKFLPTSMRRKSLTASEDPQQTRKNCAFFFF